MIEETNFENVQDYFDKQFVKQTNKYLKKINEN